MARTFYTSTAASDLTSGGSFSNAFIDAQEAVNSISLSAASGGGTDQGSYFTESGVPGTDGTSTGDFVIRTNIATAQAGVNFRVNLMRVNSAGTVQATVLGTYAAASAGLRTQTFTDPALGTWAAGDRLRVQYQIQNTNSMGGAKGITFETGQLAQDTPFAAPAGPQTVSPELLGLSSVFAPTVDPGTVTVAPALLGGAQVFEPLQISQTVVGVLLGVAQLFSPAVQPGAVNVQPDTRGGAQLFAPSIGQAGGTQTVAPTLIGPGDLFAPTVDPGVVSVEPPLLGGVQTFAPTIQTGSFSVAPDLLGPSSLFAPSVSQAGGPQAVEPTLLGPAQVYAGTVDPGVVSVEPPVLGGVQTFAPTIQTGSFSVAPDLLGPSSLFAPSVSQAGGPQAVELTVVVHTVQPRAPLRIVRPYTQVRRKVRAWSE